jgi:hypothetical protein
MLEPGFNGVPEARVTLPLAPGLAVQVNAHSAGPPMLVESAALDETESPPDTEARVGRAGGRVSRYVYGDRDSVCNSGLPAGIKAVQSRWNRSFTVPLVGPPPAALPTAIQGLIVDS